MLRLYGRVGSVNSEVCLQVAFGGECPATDTTLERPLSCVRSVMHLEGTLAAEDSMTNETLIGVGSSLVNILHKLLQFQSL